MWLSAILAILRLIGFSEEADSIFTAWKNKRKAKEVENAQQDINRLDDVAVDKRLRDEYTRKD